MLYLLRVGADSTYGGFYSPIFKGNHYLFIPIPDNNIINQNGIKYSEYKWFNKLIHPYVPKELINQTIHNDPEFTTCIYGSPKYSRKAKNRIDKNYSKLSNLKSNDIILFYSAFTGKDDKNLSGLYFFAYFIIDKTISYSTINSINEEQKKSVQNNHHFIHKWENQVIVIGNKDRSKVFEKAILLSSKQNDRIEKNYYPCENIERLGDYHKSMNMSSIREIRSNSEEFKDYLDKNSGKNLLII